VGKKDHTLKNTVMSMPDKWIVFVGRTFSGHNHDYRMLKQELPPDLDWFSDLEVWVDLGYQGIRSDYGGDLIEIPHKKPPKSKTNPHPELTAEQRAENRAVSQVRIFVEHAIGGMKRFNILVQRFRNRKEHFEDDSVGVCAGLWNLNLCY
jgi:hypothetical protein